MPAYFIGIDIGLHALKAVVVDEEGQVCGQGERALEVTHPAPGLSEQDAGRWLRSAAPAVASALRRSQASPDDIAAVGIAAMRDGFTAVDEHGEPLHPAIVWPDNRAAAQCARLAESIPAADLAAITGLNFNPSHGLPKILWMFENEPEIKDKAARIVSPGALLLHALTGEWAMDYAAASTLMALDVKEHAWSSRILEAAGIDEKQLPALARAVEKAGGLSKAFSADSGLRAGTPVIVGTVREQAAAMGAGAFGDGMVCDILGNLEPVGAASAKWLFDEQRLLETHASLDGDSWYIQNSGFVSGENFRWLRDNFGRFETEKTKETFLNAYDLLNEQAAAAPPGSDGVIFFPFMMGAMAPEWNPHARGMVAGLTLDHGRSHVIRAILEGAAYALRDVVERMDAMGLPVREIRVVGGGARSTLMEEIRAHVTGCTVTRTSIPDAAAYGAAMLAAVGAGHFKDINESAARWVRIARTHEPDMKAKAEYDAMYEKYRLIYNRLRDDFKTLWGGG